MTTLIMETLKEEILSMGVFDPDSVVINDWSPLDRSFSKLPLILINQSGLQSDLYPSMDCPIRTWVIPIFIINPLIDWGESMLAISNFRTAILDHFDKEENRNLTRTKYLSIEQIADINPNQPIVAYEDPNTTSEMDLEALPMLLEMGMLFTIEERIG